MQSLLLVRFGGGIRDLDIGEVFLADCAEGVEVYNDVYISLYSFFYPSSSITPTKPSMGPNRRTYKHQS